MWKYKVNNQSEAGKFVRMLIESKANEKDEINIGIPGGRSILPILNEFNDMGKNTLEKLRFFLVDERIEGETNSELLYSNFFDNAMNTKMLSSNQIIFPKIDGDSDEIISNYENALPKEFDVLIFGVGEDGHIASLFPENESNLSENKIIYIDNAPKEPPKRISLTFSAFNNNSTIVLLFFGEGKKEALKRVMNGDGTNKLPASKLLEYNDVHIITDLNFD